MDKPQATHPYCQICGWRKGGMDSWDGKSCKCGDWEPALPQHGIEAIKSSVAQAEEKS